MNMTVTGTCLSSKAYRKIIAVTCNARRCPLHVQLDLTERTRRKVMMEQQNTSAALEEPAVQELASHLRGALLRPGDAGYEQARQVYNAMINKHPALIARCVGVADVIAAVTFACEHQLPLAVRGGGHNGPGLGTCDDGLVIDLSEMKGVRVDPVNRTARVAGGSLWGEVDHATHPFGLATPSGFVSSTGVGGLTLGGGIGYLSRTL